MSDQGALAIFVKTPGLSPVKTRLAASIGPEAALQFYQQAVLATSALALEAKKRVPNLEIYWAVAEPEGMSSKYWMNFERIYQGSGGLGQRLHTVYSELLKRHDYVCFLGADSPHVSIEKLVEGLNLAREVSRNGFVLGETMDGGFYFFGGGLSLPSQSWMSVEYSSQVTAKQFEQQLLEFGKITRIDENFDVDTLSDLKKLNFTFKGVLPEQAALFNWVHKSFHSMASF